MSLMFRRKTETKSFSGRSKQGTTTIASPCPVQGPYAFSDITRLPNTVLDGRMPVKRMEYSFSSSLNSFCDDYENVTSMNRESGFVSNDIYESCKSQSQQCHSQTGWVENEIYGWFRLYSSDDVIQCIPGKEHFASRMKNSKLFPPLFLLHIQLDTRRWRNNTCGHQDLNRLWFTKQKHPNQLSVTSSSDVTQHLNLINKKSY